jgi:hypothetical protein
MGGDCPGPERRARLPRSPFKEALPIMGGSDAIMAAITVEDEYL